jgi:hypothetical protein
MADYSFEQLAERTAKRQIVGNGNNPADQAHQIRSLASARSDGHRDHRFPSFSVNSTSRPMEADATI